MKTSLRKGRKGISPVISTIIIVAIAIAVAIAVAYWMVGITAAFTRFERLEVTQAYATTVTGGYNITMTVKNTGSAPASVDVIIINGRMCDVTKLNGTTTQTSTISLGNETYTLKFWGDILIETRRTLSPGDSITFVIECVPAALQYKGPFVPGVNLDCSIHTASGKEYPKVVPLP